MPAVDPGSRQGYEKSSEFCAVSTVNKGGGAV